MTEGLTIVDHFFWLGVILLLSRVATLIERFGQPAVLGELIVGIFLGNLVLLGWHGAEALKHAPVIHFLAQLGVVILLFQVGLESNIEEIRRVGPRVVVVSVLGVAVPFFLGYAVLPPIFLPEMTFKVGCFSVQCLAPLPWELRPACLKTVISSKAGRLLSS